MKLVVFGLTISSSWGNGHATIWRGLSSALAGRGHEVVFFERDAPCYAGNRDLTGLPGVEIRIYKDWKEALPAARRHLSDADVGMVTSYCPDGVAASELVVQSPVWLRAFYDLDTPVTLKTLKDGGGVPYIGPRGLRDFDIVLSYTGGEALTGLKRRLGARRVRPLYGCVDPEVHRPSSAAEEYRADLSYLGTYSKDRQETLARLFIEPSLILKEKRFILGGSLYPDDFPWNGNIRRLSHVPPPRHTEFFSSSRFTLNVTRKVMAETGWCPSGRLFEAAACGAPVLSDSWQGMEDFFEPGEEIIIVRSAEDVRDALEMPDGERLRIAREARQRTLDEHTSLMRASELEDIFNGAFRYEGTE